MCGTSPAGGPFSLFSGLITSGGVAAISAPYPVLAALADPHQAAARSALMRPGLAWLRIDSIQCNCNCNCSRAFDKITDSSRNCERARINPESPHTLGNLTKGLLISTPPLLLVVAWWGGGGQLREVCPFLAELLMR